MKKIFPVVLAIPLTFSSLGLSPAHAEEVVSVTSPDQIEDGYTVYEPEISSTEKTNTEDVFYFVHNTDSMIETAPFIKAYAPNKTQGPDMVQVPDGTAYTWDYVETDYGSNVVSNTASTWLVRIAGWGTAGTFIFKAFTSAALKAIAGGLANHAVMKASSYVGKNVWWKVVKYTDYDSRNSYVKYAISIYTDSSRQKLITQYVEIHRGER